MENKQPTQEQIKEVWEWCGFKLRCPPDKDAYGRGIWGYPNGTYGDLELDLNNLFRWAVPKLAYPNILLYDDKNIGEWYCKLTIEVSPWEVGHYGIDPALALFWAIWEVIHGS